MQVEETALPVIQDGGAALLSGGRKRATMMIKINLDIINCNIMALARVALPEAAERLVACEPELADELVRVDGGGLHGKLKCSRQPG